MSAIPSPSPQLKNLTQVFERGIQSEAQVEGKRNEKKGFENGGEINEEALPFRVGYLTPMMVEEARTKLHETEEAKLAGLASLRKLIEMEPNFSCPMDENFLLQFLRARKYDVERAFKLLQSYFAFRKEYSYIIDDSDTKTVKNLVMKSFLGFLTSRDRNGSVVFIAKAGMWDPDQDSFENMFRAISGCLVHANEDPATQVTGYRAIFDISGLTWKQMKYCTPQNIFLIVRSTQYCFPARYKGIHIVSSNKLFHIAWSIAYPFLTKKLKKRVHLHKDDIFALREFICPSVLPEEFGGLSAPFDNASWDKIIENAAVKARDLMRYGYK